jgi:hypothetical protein
MKPFVSFAIALFLLSIVHADDIGDARVAFAKLVEYQKTDDIRSLDLFAEDCAVTFTFTDGVTSRVSTFPPDAFREMLKQSLALKQGNKDVYEDVKYAQEESGVRVTSNILYAESAKRGPFSALYVRGNGGWKIKELKLTIPVNALPPE